MECILNLMCTNFKENLIGGKMEAFKSFLRLLYEHITFDF